MPTTTLNVVIPEKEKFGFNTTPVKTVGTSFVDPSMDPYGVGSSRTPAPAPAPTKAPEPTIGETLESIKTRALGIQDQLNEMKKQKTSLTGLGYDTTENQYEIPLTEAELRKQERDIQRSQMRLFQKEIDATNKVYNDMLNQERLAGQGRLGTQTAMAARGGLLGSDFGEAQRQNQVSANLGAEQAVQNERLAKIGTIMGTMRKAVADEIVNKRLARQQDAESYTKYLASSKERRTANLKLAATALIDSGIDIDSMSPEELAAIGKEANLSANDIIMAYKQQKAEQDTATADRDLKTRKTNAEIAKLEDGSFNLSEGQSRYDAQGNVIASKGKTYAPGTGSGSSLDLTGDGKRTLLGGGWSETEIGNLQSDVRAYGLTEVINQAKSGGASASQISALEKAYKAPGDESGEAFLTADYFKSLFGDESLKESAKKAGVVTGGDDYIPFNESPDTDTYVNNLMNTVELYRQAGYTDQEILKMMQ